MKIERMAAAVENMHFSIHWLYYEVLNKYDLVNISKNLSYPVEIPRTLRSGISNICGKTSKRHRFGLQTQDKKVT
jgi:hypothetical protein